MQVFFDQETHRYTDGSGNVLPSVTQILRSVGMNSYPDNELTTLARLYGSELHRLTYLTDRGWMTPEERADLTPEHRDPLEGYLRWMEDNPHLEFRHLETPLAHPTYHYAGTPDRICIDVEDLVPTVVELKFGQQEPWHIIQSSAYIELVRVNCKELFDIDPLTFLRGLIVYIDKWGKVSSVKVPDWKGNLQTFLCAVHVVRWKVQKGAKL